MPCHRGTLNGTFMACGGVFVGRRRSPGPSSRYGARGLVGEVGIAVGCGLPQCLFGRFPRTRGLWRPSSTRTRRAAVGRSADSLIHDEWQGQVRGTVMGSALAGPLQSVVSPTSSQTTSVVTSAAIEPSAL